MDAKLNIRSQMEGVNGPQMAIEQAIRDVSAMGTILASTLQLLKGDPHAARQIHEGGGRKGVAGGRQRQQGGREGHGAGGQGEQGHHQAFVHGQ